MPGNGDITLRAHLPIHSLTLPTLGDISSVAVQKPARSKSKTGSLLYPIAETDE
jgi:hypothetical protein